VATCFQQLPELPVVVDFSVEDGEDGAVLVADWLIASLQIDDAEAAHPQRQISVEICTRAVGATML